YLWEAEGAELTDPFIEAVFNKLPEKSRCVLFQRMLTIVYVAQSEAVELVSAALDPSNGRAARKARSFARCLSCLSYSVFRNFQMAAATDLCYRLKPTKAGKAVRFKIRGAVSSARCGRLTHPQQRGTRVATKDSLPAPPALQAVPGLAE